MKVLSRAGNESIATVYIGKLSEGRYVEFVEALQPPLTINDKWVLIVSTLLGCPVGCSICDAGSYYLGKLSEDEIFSQIDYLVVERFPDRLIPVEKFKIQFARLGEPAFNLNVLEVLKDFKNRYSAPGFMPSISTVAPRTCYDFFDELIGIKDELYGGGRFQMQFSLHSTSEKYRDENIPVKKWNFNEISEYGERFFEKGDRKVTLNFALSRNAPFDPDVISGEFDPEKFLVKITPVNPTRIAVRNNLDNCLDSSELKKKTDLLKKWGFTVIESIGELEENGIGSNCGQHLLEYFKELKSHKITAYKYRVEKIGEH